MKSKKALFKALAEIHEDDSYITQALKHPKIGNETYGKTSCIYVQHKSAEERRKVEAILKQQGFRVCSYTPVATSEIQVSYFKGHKWDE